ncbi:MAG: carboxylesterase/lipase family protein [Bacteroidales bacterium]|nr:carboxylesterase/lipase family protein [Bacteroidales bacterium]
MTLKSVSVFLAISLLAAACGQNVRRGSTECLSALETSSKASTVSTQSGPVCGYIDNGVFIYKGIPYGQAERFMPPTDPEPWKEVRASRAYGPVSPHGERRGWRDDNQAFAMHWDDGYPGEDCLRVNVWTSAIKADAKMPVMVWLHGGGFSEGSSQEQAGYDGTNLARNHGVVVVSLNHRLNALGFLDLSAYGAKYAFSGNVGMMDIVKALEWVKANISAFGGDPSNVTIFGQSGGGGKVSTVMAMPSAQGLYHKAIVQSGSITTLMNPKYSRRIGAATVAHLGISPAKIDEMAAVPYEKLLAAYREAVQQVAAEAREDGAMPENFLDMILFGQCPVVDGEVIPFQPATPEALALSKDVPAIIGTVLNEFTPDQEDPIFRPLALKQAADRTAAGCAPVYLYRFDWATPVLDGVMGSTHCLEIPFVFDNVLLHRTFTGGADDAVQLGHRISSAWAAFAKTGTPAAEGLPEWTPYPANMNFNIESTINNIN